MMLAWSWQTDYMLFALVRDYVALRRLANTVQLSEGQDRRASDVPERATTMFGVSYLGTVLMCPATQSTIFRPTALATKPNQAI